jgi:hypothetical protein
MGMPATAREPSRMDFGINPAICGPREQGRSRQRSARRYWSTPGTGQIAMSRDEYCRPSGWHLDEITTKKTCRCGRKFPDVSQISLPAVASVTHVRVIVAQELLRVLAMEGGDQSDQADGGADQIGRAVPLTFAATPK